MLRTLCCFLRLLLGYRLFFFFVVFFLSQKTTQLEVSRQELAVLSCARITRLEQELSNISVYTCLENSCNVY